MFKSSNRSHDADPRPQAAASPRVLRSGQILRQPARKNMRLVAALLVIAAPLTQAQEHSFKPPAGFVPNESTALAIGIAVLTPIYGPELLNGQRPFKAALVDGKWHVQGSLPPGYHGGVAEIWIGKSDARVLRVTHGR